MAGKILIVDDVATNRIVLKAKLRGARYDTIQAGNGTEALAQIATAHPDLVLLDVNLPDMSGIDLCRRIKSDPATADIAIVMVTAHEGPETRIAALRAGASDFLTKPFDEMALLARMRSLLRAHETDFEMASRETVCRDLGFADPPETQTRSRVGLIAETPEMAVLWRSHFTRLVPDADFTILPRDSVLGGTRTDPAYDGFVIAANLEAKGEGLRLMSELRSRSASRHAAICIAVEQGARETAAVALDLGADDLVALRLQPEYVAEEAALRLKRQLKRKKTLDRQRNLVSDGLRLAMTDPLTGLFNRRYANPHLARLAAQSDENGKNFAVMVLDLDHFKSVNDRFGHLAGDLVLIEVAKRLGHNLRETDMLARVGGEEFLIAMPDTNFDEARTIGERLCHCIDSVPFDIGPDHPPLHVTISIGMALSDPSLPAGRVQELILRADNALLSSKAHGRNQLQVSPSAA